MRPIHIVLAASLVANALIAWSYFQTRRELERTALTISGSAILDELAFTPAQTEALREMRRTLRLQLRTLRNEWQPLFDNAVTKMRAAKPGDTDFEPALLATGEVRRRQTVVIARELIAFREQLDARQRELFNRHIGEWPFIESLIGLGLEGTRAPPSGPFRGTPAPPAP
jgi:hypothetical protein